MANYASLKSDIQRDIKQNGANAITGNLLQSSLLAMINSLGVGYQYMGLATPSTNPGTPDQNVFYIAWIPGTYANFNNEIILNNEFAILKYNGVWQKETVMISEFSALQTSQKMLAGLQSISLGNYSSGYYTVSGTTIQETTSYGKKYQPVDISQFAGKKIAVIILGDPGTSGRVSAITDSSNNVLTYKAEIEADFVENGYYAIVLQCPSDGKYLYVSINNTSNLIDVISQDTPLMENSGAFLDVVNAIVLLNSKTTGLFGSPISNTVQAVSGQSFSNTINVSIKNGQNFTIKTTGTSVMNGYFVLFNGTTITSFSGDVEYEFVAPYDINTISITRGSASVTGTGNVTLEISGETIYKLRSDIDANAESIGTINDEIADIQTAMDSGLNAVTIHPTLSTGKYYIYDSIEPQNGSGYYTPYANAIDLTQYRGKNFYFQTDTRGAISGRCCLIIDGSDNIIAYIRENELQYVDGVYKAQLPIAQNASKLLLSYSTDTSNVKIQIGTPLVQIKSLVYVNPQTGNDNNNGTKDYPVATFAKAIAMTDFETNIIFEGTTSELINIKQKDTQAVLRIIGKFGSFNKIVRGTKYQTVVQSGQIYKIENVQIETYESMPYLQIFQDGIYDSSTLIPDNERLPMQRGMEYRCEHTLISRVNSLDQVTTSDYKYYYDATEHAIYFNAPNNNFTEHPIVIPDGSSGIFGNDGTVKVELCNVQFDYCMANLSKCHDAVITDCRAGYNRGAAGFKYDLAVGIKFERCEAVRVCTGTSTGDGFNAHATNADFGTAPVFSKHVSATLIDCWSHDNFDDGYSDHERSETVIRGGLYEYNGKSGITPSYGSHCCCYNVVARHNYNGIQMVGNVADVTPSEGGKYGQLLCIACISAYNTRGSGVHCGFGVNGNGNRVELYECISIGNSIGYYADENTSILLHNCKTLNDTTIKSGDVTIENGTLITE